MTEEDKLFLGSLGRGNVKFNLLLLGFAGDLGCVGLAVEEAEFGAASHLTEVSVKVRTNKASQQLLQTSPTTLHASNRAEPWENAVNNLFAWAATCLKHQMREGKAEGRHSLSKNVLSQKH